MALVECVANFSEGRDPSVVDGIVAAAAGVPGVAVLDVSSGAAANRTVVTLAGAPDAVVDAAFCATAEAVRTIDMRTQRGVHPRLGAADVLPLVPLRGVTLDDCVDLAHRLASRIGGGLGVPVYRYGAAADPGRPAGLAVLRRGQTEGLAARLASGRLLPDHGPRTWTPAVARSGASIVGARGLLVALNITLDRDDVETARAVAALVRSRGAVLRDESGAALRDPEGRPVRARGPFAGVRAIGWSIAEYGRAQVSLNLVTPLDTPVAAVFRRIEAEAAARGVGVAGAELIGLCPAAVIEAVSRDTGGPASGPGAWRHAVAALRLDHLGPVTPADLVLEARLAAAGMGS